MKRASIALAYVGTVVFANWITSRYGLVTAGLSLLVPAGTYAAGFALGLRDTLQDAAGVRWALAAIGVGTVVSFLAGDARIAAASGIAFLLAELADLAVYTPLRRKGWRRAVLASNAVGGALDTLLFLSIAGFPVTGQSVAGQVLVKAVWCTAAYVAFREVRERRALSRQRLLVEGA